MSVIWTAANFHSVLKHDLFYLFIGLLKIANMLTGMLEHGKDTEAHMHHLPRM